MTFSDTCHKLCIAASLALAAGLVQAQRATAPVSVAVPVPVGVPGGAMGTRAVTVFADPVEVPLPQLCATARSGDVEALNQLAWVYTQGKGTARNDAYASYLFYAASSQGHEGARRMMRSMTWPAAEIPPCLTEAPAPPPVALKPVEAPAPIDKLVRAMAPKYQLDPLLVLAFIDVESNFNPFALSPKNAMGLMQLIPETAQRFGVLKPFDAKDNVQGGMAYLRWLMAYFEGNLTLVAAAYNAGEGAVEKYRGVPPFAETQDYVRKVLERVGVLHHPFDARVTRPSAAMRGVKAAEPATSTAPSSTVPVTSGPRLKASRATRSTSADRANASARGRAVPSTGGVRNVADAQGAPKAP